MSKGPFLDLDEVLPLPDLLFLIRGEGEPQLSQGCYGRSSVFRLWMAPDLPRKR